MLHLPFVRFTFKNRKLHLKKINALYLFGSVTGFRDDLASTAYFVSNG